MHFLFPHWHSRAVDFSVLTSCNSHLPSKETFFILFMLLLWIKLMQLHSTLWPFECRQPHLCNPVQSTSVKPCKNPHQCAFQVWTPHIILSMHSIQYKVWTQQILHSIHSIQYKVWTQQILLSVHSIQYQVWTRQIRVSVHSTCIHSTV